MENQTSHSLEMFSSSTEVAKLFEALAKAQAEMKPAVMDMKNPHFNSKYASLTACQDAYRGPLSKYSLCLTQQIFSTDTAFYMRSVLGHSSGQWISNVFKLIVDRQNMQGLGSAITYARRYGANSLVGVVDTEDDDGNGASAKPPQEPAKQKTTVNPRPTNPPVSQDPILVQMVRYANEKQIPIEEMKEIIKRVTGLEKKSTELNNQEIEDVFKYLKMKFS